MIKTKYYSDLTKKFYDVPEEAEKEEKALAEKNAAELKKKEEKASRAKEIEDAYKVYLESYDKYLELRNAFIKDFGSYHMTYKNNTPKVDSDFFGLFDWFI